MYIYTYTYTNKCTCGFSIYLYDCCIFGKYNLSGRNVSYIIATVNGNIVIFMATTPNKRFGLHRFINDWNLLILSNVLSYTYKYKYSCVLNKMYLTYKLTDTFYTHAHTYLHTHTLMCLTNLYTPHTHTLIFIPYRYTHRTWFGYLDEALLSLVWCTRKCTLATKC